MKKEWQPGYELRITPSEMTRIVEWALTPNRKPAIIAFTSGAARDTARVFEAYFGKLKSRPLFYCKEPDCKGDH